MSCWLYQHGLIIWQEVFTRRTIPVTFVIVNFQGPLNFLYFLIFFLVFLLEFPEHDLHNPHHIGDGKLAAPNDAPKHFVFAKLLLHEGDQLLQQFHVIFFLVVGPE